MDVIPSEERSKQVYKNLFSQKYGSSLLKLQLQVAGSCNVKLKGKKEASTMRFLTDLWDF